MMNYPAPPKRLRNKSPVTMGQEPSTSSRDSVMAGQGLSTSTQDSVASERQVRVCFTHFNEFNIPKYDRGTLKKQGKLYRNKTKLITSH